MYHSVHTTSRPRGSRPSRFKGPGGAARDERRALAKSTLNIIDEGHYIFKDVEYDLQPQIDAMLLGTRFYADESLSFWEQPTPTSDLPRDRPTDFSVMEMTTLEGANYLSDTPYLSPGEPRRKIGVLNFASARKPGGGFKSGAQAQEESIARSSTLFPSLVSPTGEKFYRLHNKNPKGGYYSHSMIFSPNVAVFRTDQGELKAPIEIDVVTSAAVNAGIARRTLHAMIVGEAEEERIGTAMKERMGRILFLFEKHGIKDLVLGSFGTGVFQNQVPVVAAIWADLLTAPDARFANSFDRVVFAILGRHTYVEFNGTFEERRGAP